MQQHTETQRRDTRPRRALRPARRAIAKALAATIIASAAAAAATVPSAQAAEYDVVNCRGYWNEALPAGDSNYGWQPTVWSQGGGGLKSETNCGDGSMGASIGWEYNHPLAEGAGFMWWAPPDTEIREFEIWWAGAGRCCVPGHSGAWIKHSDQAVDHFSRVHWNFVEFGSVWDAWHWANRVDVSDIHAQWIKIWGGCAGAPGAVCEAGNGGSDQVWMRVFHTRTVLEDPQAPLLHGIDGSLKDYPALSGTAQLAIHASDKGSGIWRAIVEVDGTDRFERVLNDNHGRCAKYGQRGHRPQWLYAQPCATSLGGAYLPIDTTAIAEGDHTITVKLQDAAGNVTKIYEARKTIDNIPPPQNTARPVIVGEAEVPNTLVGQLGGWTGQGNSYSARWLRCNAAGEECKAIENAVSPTYKLVDADVGARIRYEVTARNSEGQTAAQSLPTDPVKARAGGPATPQPQSENLDFDNDDDKKKPGGAPSGPAGTPNGDGATRAATLTAEFVRNRRPHLTIAYGTRPVVRGKLTDTATGKGIGNARIEVVHGLRGRPAQLDKGGARTRADGTYTMILPKGLTTRRVGFGYRAYEGDQAYAAHKLLNLKVRAGTTIAAGPRQLRNGQTVRFRGNVAGPIPRGGVQLVLQAQAGRKWLTFRSVRTNSKGRWRSSYRFRRTFRPTRFTFRARVLRDNSFPFEPGVSRRVRVRVS